jgi:hypothetical protein
MAAGMTRRGITEFVQDDEVYMCEVVGEAAGSNRRRGHSSIEVPV